jgi:AAA+ ATPase superfamily predicted ATPase
MFVGREEELSVLKEFKKRKVAGIIVCCGRRRIGKSTLIVLDGVINLKRRKRPTKAN